MEFLLIAYDGTDEAALERRMSIREEHLAYARKLYQSGKLIKGGAFLNEDGKMVGSTIIYQADAEAEVQEIIANDPYKINGVWVDIDVKAIRLANLD
ncbi:YciI family protein [Tunicatimonas pelagia]|uniref:YciI family protein n=1 Tax=Tunicatimonas pelagia TaxID=931531 RepID=UPI00266527E7|nr:YciI family protein [Tunicatimonas pelagia]WKN45031.1 YciI family protein [Tunicatimonas pelagia]